ncbi:MAG: hypothetical protein R2784_13530 [Saprospiraceae bacterium]
MKTKSFVMKLLGRILIVPCLFLAQGLTAQDSVIPLCENGIRMTIEKTHWFEFSDATDFENLDPFDLLKAEERTIRKEIQYGQTSDGNLEAFIKIINPEEVYEPWMDHHTIFRMNKDGYDVLDQNLNVIRHFDYSEKEISAFSGLELSFEELNQTMVQFPELSELDIAMLHQNGFSSEIDGSEVRVFNQFENYIFDSEELSIEYQKLDNGNLVSSSKQEYFQNESGELSLSRSIFRVSTVLASGNCGNFVTVTNYLNSSVIEEGIEHQRLTSNRGNKDLLNKNPISISEGKAGSIMEQLYFSPNPANSHILIRNDNEAKSRISETEVAITDLNGKL